jgi:Uma2 family endonuclease
MPTVLDPPRPVRADLLTADDFFALPGEDKQDLINGHLTTDMAPPSRRHEDIAAFLLFLMRGYASAKGLGKVYGSKSPLEVDARNVFEPDVVFVAAERAGIVPENGRMTEPPDVVVEIVSPSSRRRDRVDKRVGYERAGVAEYWLIDPDEREAAFFCLGPDGLYADATPPSGQAFASTALPGFRLLPSDVLADPLPNEFELLTRMLA